MRNQNRHSISVIGAGKVGSTLAVMLHRSGYRILSVVSKNKKSARKLANLTGCKKYSDSLSAIHPATNIILLAVPEEDVSGIAEEIASRSHLHFKQLAAFHTSGPLTSDTLLPLHRKGAMVFTLHPIQSFPKGSTLDQQLARMNQVTYGFEGIKAALPLARQLVKAIDGKLVQIPKEEKILYHIACVFASNYSIALLGAVEKLAKHIGGGIRLSHFQPLVKTSSENAFRLTPGRALTGPIVRGSVETIEMHMRELRKTDRSLMAVYRQNGLQALNMAVRRKTLKPKVARQIQQILES
jgi:predicted short-subunit dehydrogenase-like oxidoreductase (DUF2520 family)